MFRLCLFLLIVISTSCSKEFINPYDPATRADEWMPRDFRLDTLGINSLHLHWQQDNRHIDGYVVQKYTNGALKEYLVFRDTIDFIDSNAVEANTEATCPEIRYEVLARAGRNRSDAVGMQSPIYMPLSVPAYAGEDVLITDTTTTIQLNAQAATAGEAGRWSIVSGSGGSFANDRQHNTTFTGTPCNAYVLRWTKQGCTETFDEVNVSFYPSLTIASAGNGVLFTNSTTQTTLNANAPGLAQTGLWTIVSGEGGTFSDATAPNTTFSGQSCTEYVLKWTISGSCGSSDDNVTIKFMKATTAANAGVDQTFTSNVLSTTLTANAPSSDETGTWSVISGSGGAFSNVNEPNATFTGSSCTNYILRWTILGSCSSNSDDVNISFQQSVTQANAGLDQSITTNTSSVNLAANNPGIGETGTWSIVSGSGGSFSNINAPNAMFTGSSCTSYTLRWTVQGLCSTSTNDVYITFQYSATANAGPDQSPTNANVVTLAANSPSNGATGTWSITSGTGGSFSNIYSQNSTFTGAWDQTYVLKWSLNSCGNISFDETVITFPINDLHTCGAINVHNSSINSGSMTDQQGHVYKTVVVGAQEWMAENLNVTAYRNGDPIANIADDTQWAGLTTGAWCSYNNNSQFHCPYGKLYNWYAIADQRNLCPIGWHIPTNAEWTVLTNYLGGTSVAGGKMKSSGMQYWTNPNTGATNASGFSGLPGGWRNNVGSFVLSGTHAFWWSSTESSTNNVWSRALQNNIGSVSESSAPKTGGLPVRCVKD